jgi:hypothetical protein
MKNIVRKNRWRLGNFNINLIAFASMLTNKKRLPYAELLKLLIVVKEDWNRSIKESVNSLNREYVESLLHCLLTGKKGIYRSSELLEEI